MSAASALAEMRDKAAPCVRLAGGGTGRSRIGGLPEIGSALPWPAKDGRALSFLAQIDLAALRAARGPDWLPAEGMLFFFYDEEKGSWGFSPDDKGGWAVIHDPAGPAPERAPPEPGPSPYPAQSVAMRPGTSLPSTERLEGDTDDIDDAGWDSLHDLVSESSGDPPWHQIGGWPHPIQNDDMELECQLAANGVYCGNPESYHSERARALRPGAAEWRLLLQLDSDHASEMMWGDSGILYFWIREEEARAGDFSNVWMILQCC